jgi:predicted small metal-binding protein
MRLIECDECGEAISAADDDELANRLGTHLREEHDLEPAADELAELVDGEAYDAMDS